MITKSKTQDKDPHAVLANILHELRTNDFPEIDWNDLKLIAKTKHISCTVHELKLLRDITNPNCRFIENGYNPDYGIWQSFHDQAISNLKYNIMMTDLCANTNKATQEVFNGLVSIKKEIMQNRSINIRDLFNRGGWFKEENKPEYKAAIKKFVSFVVENEVRYALVKTKTDKKIVKGFHRELAENANAYFDLYIGCNFDECQ